MKTNKKGTSTVENRVPFDASIRATGSRSPTHKGAAYLSSQQDPFKRRLTNFHGGAGVNLLHEGSPTAKVRKQKQSPVAKEGGFDFTLKQDLALRDEWTKELENRARRITKLEQEIELLRVQQAKDASDKELLKQQLEALIKGSREAKDAATSQAKLYRDASAQAFKSAASLLRKESSAVISEVEEEFTGEKLLEGVGEYTKVGGNHDETLTKVIEFLTQQNQALQDENRKLSEALLNQEREHRVEMARFSAELISLANEVKSLNQLIREKDEQIFHLEQ